MEQFLWQRGALSSLVHGPEYMALDIVKTEEKVRLATIDVKSSQHWKAKYKPVRIVELGAGSCCASLCGLQQGKYGQNLLFGQSGVTEFGKVCR